MEGGEELPVLILHYLQQRVVKDVPPLHQHFRQQLTPGTLPFIPPRKMKDMALVLQSQSHNLLLIQYGTYPVSVAYPRCVAYPDPDTDPGI